MSIRFPALAAITMCLAPLAADTPDYAKEAIVIQSLTTEVSFSQDGSREWHQTLSAKIQSEGVLRQFGVLAFPYASANEDMKIEYVRVKKADGSVVLTPDSSIVDTASEIATTAPTYSDLRQKQIPVKALGVGDVLEYSVRSSQQKPEVPGQFWYEHSFPANLVVLKSSVEVRVPKDKPIQLSSPKLKYETHDDANQRVYLWQYAHLAPSKPQDNQKQTDEVEPEKIRISTFNKWEDLGNWWGALGAPQAAVTPAIEQKAKDLTAGLTSDAEKARALYKFVALKFRYISISFGMGRYRPHTAEEVLNNQYGDCKDKHTLFTALLKAAGIQAWPALIGAGIKFDSTVPIPSQFNHVITVIPQQEGKYIWLDTTQETAPFGLLNQITRDEQALVIPAGGAKPFLVKTPLDPPFPTSETVEVKSVLAEDGTLTGHFDIRIVGDGATGLRSAFRQFAPTQWQALAQRVSYALNYGGEVSSVEVENLEDTEKPFHYSYEYKRKKYSDWENLRISPPLPPLGFGPGDEGDKPTEPFWTGSPGEISYRASVVLPKSLVTEPLPNVVLTSPFANYSAKYSLKDGTLFAERKMVVKKSKVSLDQWADYKNFAKGLRDDQQQLFLLAKAGEDSSASSPQKDASQDGHQLMVRAVSAMQSRDWSEAASLLRKLDDTYPDQPGLWSAHGFLDLAVGNGQSAIANFRREISLHPDEIAAYDQLSWMFAQSGKSDEAISLWKEFLSRKPADERAAIQAATLMLAKKLYAEVLALLETPAAHASQNAEIQSLRVQALVRSGRKDEGVAEAQKLANADLPPPKLNDVAYALADTNSALPLAQTLAERAVARIESESGKNSLSAVGLAELYIANSLASAWDTLGWIYFKQGDAAKAEKYITASWKLNQHAVVASHLAQVYEKQGKREAAIHLWRLALAVNSKEEAALEGLRKAGAPVVAPIYRTGRPADWPDSPSEELNKLRTVNIPSLPKQEGSAELYILLSKNGIEDVHFISGADKLKSSVPAITAAKYQFPFPNDGPEKIIRRGILSCSNYTTPSCQFVSVPVSSTPPPKMQAP